MYWIINTVVGFVLFFGLYLYAVRLRGKVKDLKGEICKIYWSRDRIHHLNDGLGQESIRLREELRAAKSYISDLYYRYGLPPSITHLEKINGKWEVIKK